MKETLRILLGFLPWIVFGIISGTIIMAVERCHYSGAGPGAGHGLQTAGQGILLDLGLTALLRLYSDHGRVT